MENTETNLGIVGHYSIQRDLRGNFGRFDVDEAVEIKIPIEGILHGYSEGFRVELRPVEPWIEYWEPADKSFQEVRNAATELEEAWTWWNTMSSDRRWALAMDFDANNPEWNVREEGALAIYRKLNKISTDSPRGSEHVLRSRRGR